MQKQLQGTVLLKYDDIVEKLGEPRKSKPGDIAHKWAFVFVDTDGVRRSAEIYDWRPVTATCAEHDYYRWHISGENFEAVKFITKLFKKEIDQHVADSEKEF